MKILSLLGLLLVSCAHVTPIVLEDGPNPITDVETLKAEPKIKEYSRSAKMVLDKNCPVFSAPSSTATLLRFYKRNKHLTVWIDEENSQWVSVYSPEVGKLIYLKRSCLTEIPFTN